MFVCVFLKVKNINLRILSDRLNVEIVVKKMFGYSITMYRVKTVQLVLESEKVN